MRLNFSAVQFSRSDAFHLQPVGRSSTFRAHAPQILGKRGDAVTLFHAEFRCVANLYPSSMMGQAPQALAARQSPKEFSRAQSPALQTRTFHGQVADDFAMRAAPAKASRSWRPFAQHIRTAVRVGFIPLPECAKLDSESEAAAMKKTADDKSAGHFDFPTCQLYFAVAANPCRESVPLDREREFLSASSV